MVQSGKRKTRHDSDMSMRGDTDGGDGGDTGIENKRRRKSSKVVATSTNGYVMGSNDVDNKTRSGASATKNSSKTLAGAKGRATATKNSVDEKKGGRGEKSLSQSGSSRRVTHKRFESEEMEILPSGQGSNKFGETRIRQASDRGLIQEESDGEAPELVTAAVGLDQSRALAEKAARAVERQKAATSQKRKERDTRLKLQAQSRKRNISEGNRAEIPPESEDDNTESSPISSQINGKPESHSVLPALLPDSILLAEPPSPPPPKKKPSLKPSLNKKKKVLNLMSKPPKDFKYGSKTVRVLENSSTFLPPRESKPSKELRESWLAGLRSGSRDGKGFIPRRKVGGGFVRK